VLTGSGDPNAVVTLTEGSTTLGTAMATDSGTWTFAPKGLADGPHTLVASETDAAGNTGSVSITFTLDTAPPALTPIANQIDQPTNQNGAMATFAATATDIVDGTDPVVFTEGNKVVRSGDTFSIGRHTITASATDAAGNTTSENFIVFVGADAGAVVAASDVTLPHGTNSVLMGSLFTASDPDGDTIAQYRFWDGTADPNSGHVEVNGAPQAKNAYIPITAGQLAQTTFQSGTITDRMWVQAYDGSQWGAWTIFNINPAAGGYQPPILDQQMALLVNYMASTFSDAGHSETLVADPTTATPQQVLVQPQH
jgi:hypothetical protein